MDWYKVVFVRHGGVVATKLVETNDTKEDIKFVHSNRLIFDNTVMAMEVILTSEDENSAISDAVYKLFARVEDAMVNETKRRFYTSLVGREPLYQYKGFEGAKEYVLQ